jgi:hypothetical protein
MAGLLPPPPVFGAVGKVIGFAFGRTYWESPKKPSPDVTLPEPIQAALMLS